MVDTVNVLSAANEFDTLLRNMLGRSLPPEEVFHGMAASIGSAIGVMFPNSADEIMSELWNTAAQAVLYELRQIIESTQASVIH
jgi:hypothetical protein